MADSGGGLTVGVLGPLEVSVGGRPVELTASRLRTLAAVLAISAGKTISIERLAAALWGEDLPENARRTVQTYAARLRGLLGAEVVGAGAAGYVVRIEPDQVDALRFVRLLDRAGQAAVPSVERALLGEALTLWRGEPFEDVASTWLEQSEAPRLLERYLAAVERRADLDLAAGRAGELVALLYEVTGLYPLREPLWVRLLLALSRCGRQAEALRRYETIRARLADELGTDPGPELQQVYTDLLAGTPPEPVEDARPAAMGQLVVPRQLPADIDGFTGREAELKALDNLLGNQGVVAAGPVVISAIAGTAGIGKTALALHWAHQVADRFPDGQLYVNLRGFGPSGQVMEPAEAIRGFLDALGVPAHRVPADLDAQAGLCRSLLAGRRMLVLLDNARNADQVRPLLPGSPTCLVIVTSRNQLSLVATEAAHPLILDLLPVDEARELLAHRLGADRIAAEPAATDQIITYCARLPLTLAIVAARAATHPTFPLHTLATQIQHTQPTLDAFAGGDHTADARTVFSWSYQTLSPEAARLFRLLGLHPGPDLAATTAASLAGLPLTQTKPLLAELTRAHLVIEHTPGRRTLHDLLRAYATELAHTQDTEHTRRAAYHRMLDHYLHTARAGALLLDPHRDPITVAEPQRGVTIEDFTTETHALAWFSAEHPGLLSTIAQAGDAGFDSHAWQLAWALMEFLERQGLWHEWKAAQHTAVDAAQRLGDRVGQAHAHRTLAGPYAYLGQYEDADAHLRRALGLYQELGDHVGQGHTHLNLGYVLELQERWTEALHHTLQSLELFLTADHRAGQAMALNAAGWRYAHLGYYQQSLLHCQQALHMNQEVGDRRGEANTWDSLGYAHHHLGQYEKAITCYRRACELFHEISDRSNEGIALTHLGDVYLAAGDLESARPAWQAALSIFDDLDYPDVELVRDKLDKLDRVTPHPPAPANDPAPDTES